MFGIDASRDLPTVLIIDDDMVSREVMATVLTMSGYTIYSAARGEEAVALLDAGTCTPDVILMDTQMPGLKGARLVKELRTRSRATVYAMSGGDVPEDILAAVDGSLSKPFGPKALKQLIEQNYSDAAKAPEAEAPVVSAETLAQLRGMMPEASVREIYAAVLADLERRADALQRAIIAGDTGEIRRIGHSIKGGCGMAGALEAARLGARLETMGDHLDNGEAIIRDLNSARANLQRMLEDEFPT
jgi:CheY-like chemotaxis protein